jgi:hypothetical protein
MGFDMKGWSQAESAKEEDYFKIMRVPAPEGVILEVGGLCTLPNGNLAATYAPWRCIYCGKPLESPSILQKVCNRYA